MLVHNVYFSLKDRSAESVDRQVRACHTLLTGHPGIEFLAVGVLAAELQREVNDLDFDVALHMIFADKAAHDRYQVSESHQNFIAQNKEHWRQVRVFDSYAAKS
ncbi:MAG: Dabb family protein [Planctomycetaceae bacterium]